eukprot:441434-Rhodomonas_salina.1
MSAEASGGGAVWSSTRRFRGASCRASTRRALFSKSTPPPSAPAPRPSPFTLDAFPSASATPVNRCVQGGAGGVRAC